MKMSNGTRFKKWLEINKPLVIGVGITFIYVVIMLAILYGAGGSLLSCSSGSLSNSTQESVEIETSVNR